MALLRFVVVLLSVCTVVQAGLIEVYWSDLEPMTTMYEIEAKAHVAACMDALLDLPNFGNTAHTENLKVVQDPVAFESCAFICTALIANSPIDADAKKRSCSLILDKTNEYLIAAISGYQDWQRRITLTTIKQDKSEIALYLLESGQMEDNLPNVNAEANKLLHEQSCLDGSTAGLIKYKQCDSSEVRDMRVYGDVSASEAVDKDSDSVTKTGRAFACSEDQLIRSYLRPQNVKDVRMYTSWAPCHLTQVLMMHAAHDVDTGTVFVGFKYLSQGESTKVMTKASLLKTERHGPFRYSDYVTANTEVTPPVAATRKPSAPTLPATAAAHAVQQATVQTDQYILKQAQDLEKEKQDKLEYHQQQQDSAKEEFLKSLQTMKDNAKAQLKQIVAALQTVEKRVGWADLKEREIKKGGIKVRTRQPFAKFLEDAIVVKKSLLKKIALARAKLDGEKEMSGLEAAQEFLDTANIAKDVSDLLKLARDAGGAVLSLESPYDDGPKVLASQLTDPGPDNVFDMTEPSLLEVAAHISEKALLSKNPAQEHGRMSVRFRGQR